MSAVLNQVAVHWPLVEPLLIPPRDAAEFEARVAQLDEVLDLIGGDEDHPLASLAARMGDVIAVYEAEHYPIAPAPAREVLRFLMQEHGLRQSDLPEIGSQGVVSEILNGKRALNTRQIQALAQRFRVDVRVFLD